jgi:septal ring factor EnvC (AmiA/AmiB activator)
MSNEVRERLSSVETQIESQTGRLEDIRSTLQELVRYTVKNEDNRKKLEAHDGRLDELEKQARAQRARWWVITTLASVLTIILNILFNLL